MKGYIDILFYKIYADIRSSFRYRLSILADIVILSTMYMFFIFSGTGKSFAIEYGGNKDILLLIGFVMWTMSIAAISSLSMFMNREANNGTLEYILNSKYPPEWYLFSELISSQILNLLVVVVLVILSVIVGAVKISFRGEMIIPILLCIIGMFGIGLIMSGISLFAKRMSSFVMIVQIFLLFVTDTIPTNNIILKITGIIPLTQANKVLRLMVSGKIFNIEIISLAITSIAFLFIGILVFRILLNKAKKNNLLLLY